ncbi:MAG: hypothetical protein LUD17_11670 [Bacteroidales bacterium]|nr:hypothetical protein [Bacteroidales bacterium]
MKRAIEPDALEEIIKQSTYGNWVDVDLLFAMVNDLCEELPTLHINRLEKVIKKLENKINGHRPKGCKPTEIIEPAKVFRFGTISELAQFVGVSVNTLKSYDRLMNLDIAVDKKKMTATAKYDAKKLLKSLKKYQKLIVTQQSKRMKTKG